MAYQVRRLPELPPYLRSARMCGCILRGDSECSWGDRCTFAHNHLELADWNKQLSQKHQTHSQLQPEDYAASREKFSDRITEELDIAVIQSPLEHSNYKKKFHNLLCWEEKEHINILETKCNHNSCKLVLCQTGFKPPWIRSSYDNHVHYGYIEKLTPDQIAYASQASEAACFVEPGGKIEARADILKTDSSYTNDVLYIAFDTRQFKILLTLYPSINRGRSNLHNVMVQFEVKHLYFDNLSRAVSGVQSDIISKLIPTSADEFVPVSQSFRFPPSNAPGIEHQMLKLDDEGKKAALKAMVQCDPQSPPLLINGSFGTGKTRVLAIGAYCFIELGGQPTRVLICAHHQASADHLVESYFGPMITREGWRVHLIRLTSQYYVLHENQYPQFYTKISQYSDPQNLRNVNSSRSLVVATTFLTAIHLSRFHPPGFFTHILIDEGAQSREPEALAPLALASPNTKIIIAGDSCQVGPDLLVLGEEARKNGLKESLLGRLQKTYETLGGPAKDYSLTLNTNYRCHASILAIPNKLFYKNLLSNAQDALPHPLASYPLLFACTDISGSGSSASNEATILLEQVKRFYETWPPVWGPKDLKKICIVTASKTQLVITRKQIHSRFKSLNGIRMLPTYDIQGQEFQAVFLSTIETIDPSTKNTCNPTKSPCDRYVFNTVLTRAKSLVVVVGSPLVLLEIEKHMVKLYGEQGRCWSLYIVNCLQNNTLIIPGLVEASKQALTFKRDLKSEVERRCKPPTTATKSSRYSSANKGATSTPKPSKLPSGIVKSKTTLKVEQPVTKKSPTTSKKPIGSSLPKQFSSSSSGFSKTSSLGRKDSASSPFNKKQKDFPTPKKSSKLKKPVPQEVAKSQPTSFQIPDLPEVHSTFYEQYKDKLDRKKLMEELTPDNYEEKFHHLLCWEEKEHDDLLKTRCDGLYEIIIYQPRYIPHRLDPGKDGHYARYGYITSEDGDKLSYAKQASEGSFIILTNGDFIKTKHVFASVPKEANFNAITFGLEDSEVQKLLHCTISAKIRCSFSLRVSFELKHSYFRRLHVALKRLPKQIVYKILPHKEMFIPFPSKEHSTIYEKEVDCKSILKLDDGQTRALNVLMKSSSHIPILVAGPFGTGKTRLLARTAYEILKDPHSRVLVCAHHQASADTFVSYFGKMVTKFSWDVEFVRVIPYKTYHSKVMDEYREFYITPREFTKQELKATQLVVTTLGTAPTLSRKLEYTEILEFFTHILIDEGAQTREPETLGPLCFAGKFTKIVIAGDHCQVGPQTLVLGEEARNYGLGISLLERLHNAYEQLGDKGRYRSVSLLTNHRCHSGILMLPSSLFYKSSLQCQFKSYLAHPTVKYPLQFICSSFDPNDTSYLSSVNEREAECLAQEMDHRLSNWSVEHSRVCVMSPSENQCTLMRNVLYRKDYKHLNNVDILKAYDIQGREYQAIFVGTSEVTSESGESPNMTKTISDPYVFNTAITRSQALVVAVGNPFLLLKREEHMVKKFGERARCWSQYIKRCMERDAFHLPRNVTCEDVADQIEQLNREIFHVSSFKNRVVIQSDSIVDAYRKVFENTPDQKRMKITISRMKKTHIAWEITEIEADDPNTVKEEPQEQYQDEYPCVLDIIGGREANAFPTDEHKKVVKIENRRNRIGAFDGDTVLVGVFNDKRKECYGRVLKVIERGGLDQKFVCRVSRDDSLVFYPVDKKNPTFINLPRLSERHELRRDIKAIKQELKSKDVVVFDNQSAFDIKDQKLPRIRDVIPLSEAKNLLFIVSFVQWNPKYRSPLGMVIDVLPMGTTALKAERLLKLKHSVEYNDDSIELPATDTQCDPTTGPLFDRVFTIDPDEAQNLDDALSLKKMPKVDDGDVFELGVHIANVAKHLSHDSREDKEARQMGTSVYGGSKGKIMHMLSMETRKKLSLTPQCVRDVVSVVARVTINGESIQIEEPRVKMAQIRSTVQLTYSNAQEIMDGKKLTKITKPQDGIDRYNSDKKQPSLSNTMQLLYKLACCMKLERLKTDAAYCYDINEPEDAHCWQTHMLVEELMIWANSTVAKRLHERFADCALLRRQGPPNEEEMKSFVSENRPLLSHSCSLSHYLALYAVDDTEPLETTDLVIPRRTLANLQTAMLSKELAFLVSLLTSDRYYPQLAAVHSQLKSNFQRAEYCCTDSEPLLDSNETISSENKPSSEYRHFSLCLDEYIHFTSPMRRYCDVMVQRMVQRMASGGPLNFNKKELRQLCHNLNSKDRNASHFEKSMKNVRLAVKFSSSSEVFDAFVSQVKKGSIELFFPDLELNSLPKREKKIRVRHIGPFNKQTGDIEQTSNPAQLYHWKVKMTSMNEKQGTHVLGHMCSRVQLKKMSGGQKEADSNISLEVLCSKDDESQTMSKQLYTAPLNTSMVVVSPEKWNTALEFVKNPTENKMTEFKAVLPDVPPANTPTTVCPFNGSSPFLNYMLKLSLSENSSLKVWMTWALQEAHITPTVQMVELSPAVRICVQHNVHPAECFSDQDLSKASRKHYQNIKEYVKLWERVLLAEAAEKSVKEFQPIIIRDVTLKWPELSVPSNCIDEVYYTIEDRPNDTIEKQSVVMKQPAHFVEQCSEFFRINVGDLMCVRYGTDPHSGTRAVFHLVVHRVDEEEDDNNRDVSTVYMKFIGDSNCRISERLVKEKVLEQSCELQLISLAISYQRVYKGLLKLDKTRPRTKHRFQKKEKPTSKLVSQIALGKEDELKKSKVPGGYREAATMVFDKDSLATTLWGLGGGKQLNKGQREAIELVLNQEFQLIQGPPGTGKSETGAHIAYMFAMANKKVSTQHCVLYCGPSNKSVDVVLSKLHSLCQHHPGFNLKILRIYSRSVERKDHISPQTHQAVSTVSDYSMAKELAEYALHVKLRECKDIKEIKVLKKLEKELIHVEENGEIPNGKLCIAHRKALVKAEEAFLNHNKFDIVLCTCNEAASHRMECISPRQCIIDESGMATEPESVTPISLCEHVVLIGDHKQLQPVIDYGPAKENGLTTSLFERYAEKLEGFTTTLTIQYRMHEAICEFPSEHFYDGKLKADHSVKVRSCPETKLEKFWPRGAGLPILFCDVVGEEGRSETGRQGERKVGIESKSNRKEAEKVVEIVRVLHHTHRVAFKQIAVLTPYSAQREEIKRVMIKHPDLVETTSGSKKPAVKVASITESQGDEYGIVILSTVRSQPLAEIAHPEHIQPDRGWLLEHLGFITDKHQINVGITRSKYGLVIVGNKMLLKYDDTWKELIQHYEKKGCVKVGRQFPCSRNLRDLVRRTAQ